jgi:cytochrome c nitrite reductase small subunit
MLRDRARNYAGLFLGVAIGACAGLGAYTFVYAKGASYLSSDPRACANCHIMQEQFDGWSHSSHRAVAGCNDCHTPPDAVGKWTTKALNGFWHSFYFTTGAYPEPIRIQQRNREVTEAACRYCHQPMVEAMATGHTGRGEEETSCIRCHASVGHLH